VKTIFAEDGRYTPEGLAMNTKVTDSLKPLMENYLKAGFAVRDIGHVMTWAALDLEGEMILNGKTPKVPE